MTKKILLLLVEDEPMILVNLEEALLAGGYDVVSALDGSEAMARLGEYPEGFAGLITDIRLGAGIDGWEVARRVREVNAAAAVVYMTGDSGGDWPIHGVPKSQLIQKPFAHAQLVTAISALLTESDSSVHD